MKKKDYLKKPVRHIDITSIDTSQLVRAMKGMSFSARDLANAAEIYCRMLADRRAAVILTIAGSTSAGGCMKIYSDLVRYNMVDAVVATGAAIVDMDFFEALGFRHYQGSSAADDRELRRLYIDRIYDTYIDEEELQACDRTVKIIADSLPHRAYSSREFIREMGRYLRKKANKKDSLVGTAFENDVPIFCPAFSDSSAGFGLVLHQVDSPDSHITIDSVKDFRELTMVKIKARTTGLLMIGGGVPKNFAQDTVICAELLGRTVPMHKYAVQITVADVRDGACSSSTLKEASSWGKVDVSHEQMVFAEAAMALPILASYAYHSGVWKNRPRRAFAKLFDK
ncbi:MAG: deoxyhypusine synthase [Syntrophales bacterium]|nr:deoxyhypusine synthase [Syntrophales bacterium]MDD5533361.1 deoxyhypusine synthase [Syntrophales bacterium]